ncbi:uncharacterized protein B0P05DRAFT_558643, partial [Gilbertella persicaria]|uniref:uncharacterized protein n=1 Tax=Gilbertella persicaria TaxID=101096 RepID=UPI00221EB42C
MPIPKILTPMLSSPGYDQQKGHELNGPLLSPTIPPSPIQQMPYNAIRLEMHNSSEETIESFEETAMITHEEPAAFESCQNDVLLEAGQIESNSILSVREQESTEPLEIDTEPIFSTEMEVVELHEEQAQDEVIEQEEEKHDNEDEEIQQEPVIEEVEQKPMEEVEQEIKEAYTPENKEEEQEFKSPVQANSDSDVYSDYEMKSTFKKTTRSDSFKEKCKRLLQKIRQKKLNKKSHSHQMSPDNKAQFAFNDTYLSRSISTVTIAGKDSENDEEDEHTSAPIYRRNISDCILYNQTKTEPKTGVLYISPKIGSGAAYDIKLLCEQSFFGHA